MLDTNLGQGQPQPKAPQLTPEMVRNSQVVKCDCGNVTFSEKLTFRKISSILSPTGREEVIPLPVVMCDACGKVPAIFDPHGMAPPSIKGQVPTSQVQTSQVQTKEPILKVVK